MGTKTVQAEALRFSVKSLSIGDNGENAKTAPVSMVARSGMPINHPCWPSPIVHDFAGMQHRDRIAIDYCHDDDELLGFVNHFNYESGNLVLSGTLIPYSVDPEDMTAKVIFKAKNGVPYEASINFCDDVTIEEVPFGMAVQVNGNDLIGPLTVVRQWTLRGVAICPYGADPNTSAKFSKNQKDVTIYVIGEEDMELSKAAETETVVDAEKVNEQTAEAVKAETVETVVDALAEQMPKELSETVSQTVVEDVKETAQVKETDGQKFMATFGEIAGAVYFAKGISFGDAMTQHVKGQAEQITKLESELAELRKLKSRGLSSPVEFRAEPDKKSVGMKDMIKIK